MNNKLWVQLETLIKSNGTAIDRPKGSPHPRYPEYIYPLDYGFINNTKSNDGAETDVWLGSDDRTKVSGILVACDLIKSDVEIKVLVGCTSAEMQTALEATNRGAMVASLFLRNHN